MRYSYKRTRSGSEFFSLTKMIFFLVAISVLVGSLEASTTASVAVLSPNDKFCKEVNNCSKNSGRQDAGSLDLLKELQKFMQQVEANDKKHDARLSSMESGLQSTKAGLKSVTSRVTNVESG